MLMHLLPGLRELRAPLVSGYLWLISAWLLLGRMDWLPSKRPPGDGEVARLWDLGGTLGKTAVLASVTFIAYLIGSFLEIDPDGPLAFNWLTPLVLRNRRPWHIRAFPMATVSAVMEIVNVRRETPFEYWQASMVARSISLEARRDLLDLIVERKVIPTTSGLEPRPDTLKLAAKIERNRENEVPNDEQLDAAITSWMNDDFSHHSLGWEMACDAIIFRIVQEMKQLASRLLVKNVDLYGKYDRQMTEASVRINVSIPLTVLVVLVIWLASLPIWLRLALTLVALAFGFMLLRQGLLRAVSARDAIVQALMIGEVQSRYIPPEDSTESPPEEPAGRKETKWSQVRNWARCYKPQ